MENNIVIHVEGLTKIYQLYDKPQDRLKEALHPLKKKYHHEFYAMDNVNLQINKGETVGIIGKNGAGKSTLLKMITGVLTPTSGNIQIEGKISSLLELGAGFNPEMTGMENIYLNGTLMGFSTEEMKPKITSILDFADIGEFIYQPVKMYSSGMFARLAFSVAINVEPDILIVDEALSVGDMAFQMKCFNKFQEFQEQGRTILFVTHALDTVLRYCNRGIVIDAGKIIYDSTPKLAVDAFKKVLSGNFYDKKENLHHSPLPHNTTFLKDSFPLHKELDIYGNGKATIIDYGIINDKGKPSNIIEYNSIFKIILKVKFHHDIKEPLFAFTLKDTKGLELTGTNTAMKYMHTGDYSIGDICTITFSQKANLQLASYSLSLGCVTINDNGIEVFNRIYDALLFTVIGSQQMVGFFDMRSEITIEK